MQPTHEQPAADPSPIRSRKPLPREMGVFGATMMGLGSIIGTGVFVSVGIAAGLAGPAVILAIAVAAGVAVCNALSSAQLAANHPVSGGTYEYGYLRLHPALGFTAGWMFLCAKSASAATAALGFSGYLLHLLGAPGGPWLRWIAVASAIVLTLIVLAGMRRSNAVNIVIVSISLLALVCFIAAGMPTLLDRGGENLLPLFGAADDGAWRNAQGFLHAAALMFVAYTGYGRIATLGEEVRSPRRTIPRAIILTMIVSAALYIGVSVVAVGAVGAAALGEAAQVQAAPLEAAARQFGAPAVVWIVALGAMTAMLGVLLNLILGLSRVVLAMGRRGDLPVIFGKVDATGKTPRAAVILVGAAIASLAAFGSVRTTWSFSAFTVLIYYAITNLAALRLRTDERLYSPAFAVMGLASCVILAFWVEWRIWLTGLALTAAGLAWQRGRSGRRH